MSLAGRRDERWLGAAHAGQTLNRPSSASIVRFRSVFSAAKSSASEASSFRRAAPSTVADFAPRVRRARLVFFPRTGVHVHAARHLQPSVFSMAVGAGRRLPQERRRQPPVLPRPTTRPAGPAPWQWHQLPKPWLLSGAVFVVALGYTTTSLLAAPAAQAHPDDDAATAMARRIDLNSVYNATAAEFDSETGTAEFWSGIGRLRKRLVRLATGDVLESAAGTGRNLEYYDAKNVNSIILADRSEAMLDECKTKWKAQMPGRVWRGRYGFAEADLASPQAEQQLGGRKFDTVVQTFALCSTEEPDALLRNLGNLLTDDGQILLLEHGRSHYDWVNRFLDSRAYPRAKKFGCWWNRDIGAVVEKSGLEIVEAKRYTLGTTWWFVLKRGPNKHPEGKGPITAEPLRYSNVPV